MAYIVSLTESALSRFEIRTVYVVVVVVVDGLLSHIFISSILSMLWYIRYPPSFHHRPAPNRQHTRYIQNMYGQCTKYCVGFFDIRFRFFTTYPARFEFSISKNRFLAPSMSAKQFIIILMILRKNICVRFVHTFDETRKNMVWYSLISRAFISPGLKYKSKKKLVLDWKQIKIKESSSRSGFHFVKRILINLTEKLYYDCNGSA